MKTESDYLREDLAVAKAQIDEIRKKAVRQSEIDRSLTRQSNELAEKANANTERALKASERAASLGMELKEIAENLAVRIAELELERDNAEEQVYETSKTKLYQRIIAAERLVDELVELLRRFEWSGTGIDRGIQYHTTCAVCGGANTIAEYKASDLHDGHHDDCTLAVVIAKAEKAKKRCH